MNCETRRLWLKRIPPLVKRWATAVYSIYISWGTIQIIKSEAVLGLQLKHPTAAQRLTEYIIIYWLGLLIAYLVTCSDIACQDTLSMQYDDKVPPTDQDARQLRHTNQDASATFLMSDVYRLGKWFGASFDRYVQICHWACLMFAKRDPELRLSDKSILETKRAFQYNWLPVRDESGPGGGAVRVLRQRLRIGTPSASIVGIEVIDDTTLMINFANGGGEYVVCEYPIACRDDIIVEECDDQVLLDVVLHVSTTM